MSMNEPYSPGTRADSPDGNNVIRAALVSGLGMEWHVAEQQRAGVGRQRLGHAQLRIDRAADRSCGKQQDGQEPQCRHQSDTVEDVGDARELQYQQHHEDDADHRERAVAARRQAVKLALQLHQFRVAQGSHAGIRIGGIHAQLLHRFADIIARQRVPDVGLGGIAQLARQRILGADHRGRGGAAERGGHQGE